MGAFCNHGGGPTTLRAPPAPPAGETRTLRPRNLALFALAIGGFAIGTSEFVTMGLLPLIAEGVAISIPAAGHVVSGYALGVVVGARLIAVLAARARRRTVLLW